jgi:acyl-ACP thioesterase
MRTWPRGTQKLFAVRDYEFLDAEGKLAVRGRSGWIIFDTEKKRPLRPETIVNALPLNEGRNALPDGAGSVPGIDNEGGALRLGERTALYSDIDMNGHVNNARYIAWIEDALDPELFYKAPQLRLDINYISEVLPGETLELWTAPGQNASTLIEGRKGQCAFRAELRTRFDGAA